MKEKQYLKHTPRTFSDEIIDITDEPVVQCDVPVVKILL